MKLSKVPFECGGEEKGISLLKKTEEGRRGEFWLVKNNKER